MKQAKSYGNQQTLFPIKEVIELNIIKGREGRDEGMERAKVHAEKVNPGWNEKAYERLLEFLKSHHGEFMCEDLRAHFAMNDYELPPHNRAFGGIMMRAAKSGIIKKVDCRSVSNPKAHAANAAVWRKVV